MDQALSNAYMNRKSGDGRSGFSTTIITLPGNHRLDAVPISAQLIDEPFSSRGKVVVQCRDPGLRPCGGPVNFSGTISEAGKDTPEVAAQPKLFRPD
tara:strand:+ start:959 stop:1249 length:291 start_codon:yes stop_codon:yes gene_type:complete